ncbi:MAG TPA: DUF1073 domain-containing protein [Pseudolabrys sp.]|jgi:hypothetical protein|nr:DUF1073 domain-containing protein [Pseudolabrys sp.]
MGQREDGYESALMTPALRLRASITATGYDMTALYATGGLYAAVVDKPSDTAVKAGVCIDGDIDEGIKNELDRLNVLGELADGFRWSRLTGSSVLLIICDDGGRLNEPLNINRLRRIEEIRVFDATEVSPGPTRYADATQANYGQPTHYRLSVVAPDNIGQAAFLAHESRLIGIKGAPLPRRASAYRGVPWEGRSSVNRAYQAIGNYLDGLCLSLEMMRRKQQAVYEMEGLANALVAKQDATIQKRINLVDSLRGVRNTVAIDKMDGYHIEDANLTGVKDVVGELQVAVSAESGIPAAILFGRAPTGLNATGDADFAGFYDMVAGIQTSQGTPTLERLIALILAQQDVFKAGSIPETWHIVWPPLVTPTVKEAADVAKTAAETKKLEVEAVGSALDHMFISEEEGREILVARGVYALEADTQAGQSAARYAEGQA